MIETGLFEIQARILRQRRHERDDAAGAGVLSTFYKILNQPHAITFHDADGTDTRFSDGTYPDADARAYPLSDMPLAFLRLCKFNDQAIERLGRYEITLWRQILQILAAAETFR